MAASDEGSRSTMVVAIVALIAVAAVAFLVLANQPAGDALPGSITPPPAADIGGTDMGGTDLDVDL